MKSRRQEKALQHYLDHLLVEIEEPTAPVMIDVPPTAPKVVTATLAKLLEGIESQHDAPTVARKLETPPPRVNSEIVPEPPVTPTQPEIPPPTITSAAPDGQTVAQAVKQFREQLPPRFQAIVFRVDELKLALPLHLLGGIQKRDKTITPLPGKPAWFMGLLQHEPHNIQVVNTGRYLLGKRFDSDMSDYEFIVVIGDSQWGLACHELFTTIELEQDDIRWFAAAEKRPWLAGMLREQMCALLNTDALTLMLRQAIKKAA